MNTSHELTFDASPLVIGLAMIAWLTIGVLSWWGWRRSGYYPRTGFLELLRTIIGGLVACTLCQPEWKETYTPTERPVIAVLRDESLSMDTRDVVETQRSGNTPTTRGQWIESVWSQFDWGKLREQVEIVEERFASAVAGSDRRAGSNLDHALQRTLTNHDHLRAVVLISDGDWNEGESPASSATRLRTRGIPIFPIALGSEVPLPDIEVTSLEPPTFSVVGKAVQIPFTLRSTLPTDYETTVTLQINDQQTLERKVVIPAMGQAREVMFWTPDQTGQAQLRLHVPPQRDESLTENNSAQVEIAIKTEAIKVLIVESYPRWEYRYLRNALERDPGVDVNCLLLHPEMAQRGGGSGYLKVFPASLEELSTYDVVFLGDVGLRTGQLTAEDCERLKGLVEKQASGLVFMPGMRGFQNTLRESLLDELYPVILDQAAPRGFGSRAASHFQLTGLGETSLLTKLGDTPQENGAIWRTLPGFQWRSPATRAKAGTDLLAIDEKSRAPLLVTKTFGTGKILFMGTDGAWRWREGVEDKYHYRFWGQVARWMAYQRHMAQGEMLRVFYTPDRPTAGNTVTFHATLLDAQGSPLNGAQVVGDLQTPSGEKVSLRFQSEGRDWGLYTTRFTPELVGRHALEVRCVETGASLDVTLDILGVQREQLGKPARPDVMRELAQITDGQLIERDDLTALRDLMLQLPPTAPRERRWPIWASPWWAGTLIGLLGVFWIGRKWNGTI